MSNLNLTIAVTRTLLALDPLYLDGTGNGYEIFKLGPGSTSWRKEVVESPYTHGNTLVSAVKDIQNAPLGVRVRGSSAAQLDSRLDTLLDAFSQFSYYLSVVIDGETKVWLCEPADWSVGEDGEFNKFHLMAKIYEVSFDIPRQPVPTSGSI